MLAEDLIALTSAHAIDATKAFEVPGTGPIRWTIAEAGMACKDVPQHHYFAVLYAYAGADECVHVLHRRLLAVLKDGSAVHPWPRLVPRATIWPPAMVGPGAPPMLRDWQVDLVSLLLLDQKEPWRFRSIGRDQGKYASAMGVSPKVWRNRLTDPYELIELRFLGWLASARSRMVPRLRRPDDTAPVACL